MATWSESDAESATFLAIRPPEPIAERLTRLQADCRVATFYPHITVKAQPGLDEPDRWLPAIRATLARLPAFELSLGPPDWFGESVV